jgi:hypothetical protein
MVGCPLCRDMNSKFSEYEGGLHPTRLRLSVQVSSCDVYQAQFHVIIITIIITKDQSYYNVQTAQRLVFQNGLPKNLRVFRFLFFLLVYAHRYNLITNQLPFILRK